MLTVRGTGLSPSLNLSCAFDGGSGATLTAASAAGGGAVRCAVPSLGEVSALSRAGDLVALGNFTLAGAAARLATSIRLTPPLNRDGTVATATGGGGGHARGAGLDDPLAELEVIPPITGHEGRFCIEGANPDDPYDCVPLRDGVLEHRAAAGGGAADGARPPPPSGSCAWPMRNGAPPLADVRASALLLRATRRPRASRRTTMVPPAAAPAASRSATARCRPAASAPRVPPTASSISIGDGVPAAAGAPSVCELAIALGGAVVVNRACGAALPRDAWLRLEAVVRGGRLRVALDGRDLLAEPLHLPGWAPAADWRLGVGAAGAAGGCWLARAHIESALLLYVAPVAVTVAMRQQHAGPPLNFSYHSPPIISAISPSSGPVAAATLIVVHGANLALAGLGACALAQADSGVHDVPTLGSPTALNCTVPVELSGHTFTGGNVEVSVRSGGGDLSGGANFSKYEAPTLTSVAPSAGGAGRTVVAVGGTGLASGSDRRCRFVDAAGETAEAPASVAGSVGDELHCLAPGVSATGAAAVEVTLNGAQYTASSALSFRYLFADPPRRRRRRPRKTATATSTTATVVARTATAIAAAAAATTNDDDDDDDDAVELVAGEPVDPSSFAEAIYVNVVEPPVGPVLGRDAGERVGRRVHDGRRRNALPLRRRRGGGELRLRDDALVRGAAGGRERAEGGARLAQRRRVVRRRAVRVCRRRRHHSPRARLHRARRRRRGRCHPRAAAT